VKKKGHKEVIEVLWGGEQKSEKKGTTLHEDFVKNIKKK